MADIDKLLEYLQGQNQRLDDLLRRHVELNTTILSEGFAARIKALEEELEASEDRATKVIDKINNSIPSIANLNIDFKDIDKLKDDLEKLQELIDNANSDDEKEELVDAYEKIASAASDYYRIANEGQEELNKRQLEGIHILDDVEEDLEQRTRAFTKGINEIKSGIKQIGEGAWNMIEPWRNANHEAMAYGKSVGMSQKTADAYLSRTISWASRNDIGILFNKTTDELIKLQGKYSEVLGRNVQLTSEQKKDMLAMETFLGEDGAVDMANNLENYGMGMSDAADFIKETIDDAAKSGIHAAKLTKLVRENIKMAQNYTFKDGLRGLESMAKKAAMLKTDMTLVSGLADKVSTVEGAITTGAQLQVLGGSYALGSDPLSLLYESLNDMEGLFDRAVGMAKGKVYYNETTGNFEMGAMDRYMMKQAANSMGVDYTKMTDLAFRQASLGRIENQAQMNSNISGDKDMMELVKNLATFENGRAVIDIDGKKVDVGELTANDKQKLIAMSKTDSQNLQDMAITLRSLNDVIGGTQKEVNNEQANNTHSIASRLNTFMRENTRRLDRIAQMLSWLEIMDSTKVMIGGIWSTTKGILRSINGMRNLSGKPSNKFGTGGYHGGHQGGKKGGNTRGGTGGKKGGTRGGGGARGGAGSSWKTASIGGKGLASGLKSGLAVGAVSTVAHLGYAAVTDQDMLQATRESGVSLAGSIVGGLIGSLIPGGTAIGAMIGGMAAEAINAVITNESQKVRSATRDAIYNELSATLPSIATLFSGPNALAGDYRKGQLEDLKKALEDKTLSKGEVSESLIDKLRENGDLDRLDAAGIKFESIEMAEGGYLNDALRSQKKYHARPKHNTTSKLMSDGGPLVGPSHKQGGMAIEGTNIEVEGGEYVVSKNNVKPNAQVLEAINDGAVVKPIFPEDIHNNITQAVSKEYLGKQMQVYNTNNIITNNDNTQVVGKEPLGKQMQVYNTNNIITNNNNNSVSGNQKIEISPVSLDLSGTIKLDLNGKETDITQELLKDEVFIRNIANFISQRFNQYNYGGFNKGNFLQKFSV